MDGCASSTSPPGEELAPAEPFLPPNGKPYGLNLYNNVLYTTTAQGCGGNPNQFYALRPRDEEGRQLQSRQRRAVAAARSVDRQGRHRLRRQRRRRLLPGAADLRAGDRRREAEPHDQGARAEGLVRAVERRMAAQARPRHEHDRPGVRLQGQGIHRPVEQGVPDLAARHVRARRRGPPHARLPDAARLQRGSAVRVRRRLGRALDLGGHERHALGADAVLGSEAFAVQRADRAWRGRAGRDRGVQAGGRRPASSQLSPAWLSRNMHLAEPSVIANGVVFGYGSGEDATQATPDIGLAYNTAANRAAHSTHATLYALDARTGEELWSSGDQITSFNHFSSLSVANGRVYIGTYDGKLYCVRRRSNRGQHASRRRNRQMNRITRAVCRLVCVRVGRARRAGTRRQRRMDDERPRRAADGMDRRRRAADQDKPCRRGSSSFSGRRSSRTRRGS